MRQLPAMPLGNSAIDRNAVSRANPALIADLLESPETRVLVLCEGEVRIHDDEAGLQLLLTNAESVGAALEIAEAGIFYLGRTLVEGIDHDGSRLAVGTSILALDLPATNRNLLAGPWHNLRRVSSALTDLDAGMFAQALALANWHRISRFCPSCGTENVASDAGWSRRCPSCDKQAFPRTDPAIIVAVVDDEDRILLGSQGAWESNRWSVLAGYVEAGESLNAAVEREVLEESGIVVTDIEYVGSQPWPFPYSLMFGFFAKASADQTLQPDGEEIARLRWFSRDELLAERRELLLPGKLSIARALIESWLGHGVDEATA